MGASDNKMKILGNFLRVNYGRDSVQNHENFMKEKNLKLDDFVDTKIVIWKKYVMEETIDESGRKKKEKSKTVMEDEETHVGFTKDVVGLAEI